MGEAKPEVWEFLRDLDVAGDVWTWRRKLGAVVERRSEGPVVGFAKAMVDAVRNGFSASQNVWVISDEESDTHYVPGAETRVVRRDASKVPTRRQ